MKYLNLLSMTFGVVGIIANMIIYWQKNREKMLFAKLFADIVWTVHYSFLGAQTGAVTCGISILRETVFLNKKHRWAQSNLWLIVFVIISAGFGIAAWNNLINIFPIIAAIISVISFAIGKPSLSRILQIVISALFLAYDIYVMSYAGIINECCTLTSVIIAIFHFRQKKQNCR